MKYNNPVIRGFYPDPSICRVGDGFYLVNSSFEFFPGVPLFYSKNLAQWELVGHCLTEKRQIHLEGCHASGGIYAPTIRYHDGWFYMTVTNVSDKGNFIVHTRNPEEGWSEPCWVEQGGIDPSLFFDDDGRGYYATTGNLEDGTSMIQMCEVNPMTGEKLKESRVISLGCGGKCPEGPHIYKKDGFYYLMLAEGGTEYGHMETLQRSRNPYGPYEACPHNPILSHKDHQKGEIAGVGHGDLVEDAKGNWWMIFHGIRPLKGEYGYLMLHNLGRETFLAPVTWTEDGWLTVGNHGTVDFEMEGELPAELKEETESVFEDFFEDAVFSRKYSFLRNPDMSVYVRETENRQLLIRGNDTTLNEEGSPAWMGIRQEEFVVEAEVTLCLEDGGNIGNRAGLAAFYNNAYHYEIYLTKEEGQQYVCYAQCIHGMYAVVEKLPVSCGEVTLKLKADDQFYKFFFEENGNREEELLGQGRTAGLCTEGTFRMSFTGTFLGIFSEKTNAFFKRLKIKFLKK